MDEWERKREHRGSSSLELAKSLDLFSTYLGRAGDMTRSWRPEPCTRENRLSRGARVLRDGDLGEDRHGVEGVEGKHGEVKDRRETFL